MEYGFWEDFILLIIRIIFYNLLFNYVYYYMWGNKKMYGRC